MVVDLGIDPNDIWSSGLIRHLFAAGCPLTITYLCSLREIGELDVGISMYSFDSSTPICVVSLCVDLASPVSMLVRPSLVILLSRSRIPLFCVLITPHRLLTSLLLVASSVCAA